MVDSVTSLSNYPRSTIHIQCCFNPPVVYSTDRSKALVSESYSLLLCGLFYEAICFMFYLVLFFLVVLVLLALRLLRLGKKELILVFFVRLFDLRLFSFVCFLFLLVSGKGCGLNPPVVYSTDRSKAEVPVVLLFVA